MSACAEQKPMKPGELAKVWARVHPTASGKLLINALVPKGRGGRRGLGHRQYNYWVTDGKSAQARGERASRSFNGQCWVCGTVCLTPVLNRCFAPDPDALTVLTGCEGDRFQNQRAPLGYLSACPSCIASRDLILREYQSSDGPGDVRYVERPHPTLATFFDVAPVATLELK